MRSPRLVHAHGRSRGPAGTSSPARGRRPASGTPDRAGPAPLQRPGQPEGRRAQRRSTSTATSRGASSSGVDQLAVRGSRAPGPAPRPSSAAISAGERAGSAARSSSSSRWNRRSCAASSVDGPRQRLAQPLQLAGAPQPVRGQLRFAGQHLADPGGDRRGQLRTVLAQREQERADLGRRPATVTEQHPPGQRAGVLVGRSGGERPVAAHARTAPARSAGSSCSTAAAMTCRSSGSPGSRPARRSVPPPAVPDGQLSGRAAAVRPAGPAARRAPSRSASGGAGQRPGSSPVSGRSSHQRAKACAASRYSWATRAHAVPVREGEQRGHLVRAGGPQRGLDFPPAASASPSAGSDASASAVGRPSAGDGSR